MMNQILTYLTAEDEDLAILYQKADSLRKKVKGDAIYLRGIIEFSNYCKKNCAYCGIQAGNTDLQRYRMSIDEIIDTCQKIEKWQQTTVVLQSGEDSYFTPEILGDVITKIKQETRLAVTLSAGVYPKDTLAYWKSCGLDRYLIRFETSDPDLFRQVHPVERLEERITCIKDLQSVGIEAGSGFLMGLPGETLTQLAQDILFCTELNLDMIGVGPFISHPNTPLRNQNNPFDPEIFFKVIAILRLLNPNANIPATTAFDAINPNGRNLVLNRGANIFMPNATPQRYRKHYLLYPGKPCVDESGDDCAACVVWRIQSLGRTIGR